MRRLVVDASIVVKWLNPYETLADKANFIRDDYEQGRISLLVPAFWDYEVANGIRAYPKTPAARNVTHAQAKCKNAK